MIVFEETILIKEGIMQVGINNGRIKCLTFDADPFITILVAVALANIV